MTPVPTIPPIVDVLEVWFADLMAQPMLTVAGLGIGLMAMVLLYIVLSRVARDME